MFAREIAAQTDIDAPPETVWAALLDFPAHAEWNPFIRGIAGEARPGAELTVVLSPDGARSYVFRPRVLVVDAPRAFAWRGRLLMPGLFDGEHRFALEPVAGGTRFTQSERFSGLLLPFLGWMLRDAEAGFARMNAALKARLEAPPVPPP
jgi:hypothetical protein